MPLRVHIDCTFDSTSRSLRFHFGVTLLSLRSHIDFTPTSLRCHFQFHFDSMFGVISIWFRLHFQYHFNPTSLSLRVRLVPLRCHLYFTSLSHQCHFRFDFRCHVCCRKKVVLCIPTPPPCIGHCYQAAFCDEQAYPRLFIKPAMTGLHRQLDFTYVGEYNRHKNHRMHTHRCQNKLMEHLWKCTFVLSASGIAAEIAGIVPSECAYAHILWHACACSGGAPIINSKSKFASYEKVVILQNIMFGISETLVRPTHTYNRSTMLFWVYLFWETCIRLHLQVHLNIRHIFSIWFSHTDIVVTCLY